MGHLHLSGGHCNVGRVEWRLLYSCMDIGLRSLFAVFISRQVVFISAKGGGFCLKAGFEIAGRGGAYESAGDGPSGFQ